MQFKDEHDFQNFWVAALRRRGFVVRVTSANIRGRRQVTGMADAMVRHPSWSPGTWVHLESKNPNRDVRLTPEQHAAWLRGDIVIVCSWAHVCDALNIPLEEQGELL